jgi:hypothetical protein
MLRGAADASRLPCCLPGTQDTLGPSRKQLQDLTSKLRKRAQTPAKTRVVSTPSPTGLGRPSFLLLSHLTHHLGALQVKGVVAEAQAIEAVLADKCREAEELQQQGMWLHVWPLSTCVLGGFALS